MLKRLIVESFFFFHKFSEAIINITITVITTMNEETSNNVASGQNEASTTTIDPPPFIPTSPLSPLRNPQSIAMTEEYCVTPTQKQQQTQQNAVDQRTAAMVSLESTPVPRKSGNRSSCTVHPHPTFPSNPPPELLLIDDLDRMLLHEEFPKLLVLAVKVKKARKYAAEQQQHQSGDQVTTAPPQSPSFCALAKSSLQPNEILNAVVRLHGKLLSQPALQNKATIVRGQFPVTDSIMDDSLETLQKELDVLQDYLVGKLSAGRKNMTLGEVDCHLTNDEDELSDENPTPVSSPALSSSSYDGSSSGKSPKRGGAIAIKYAKWQTDILMKWTIENINQPFPNPEDTQMLMQKTGLSQTQVVNWTTNIRKRNRKATCQGGKKPHHFIDFLFLKQDCEHKNPPKGRIAPGGRSVATPPSTPSRPSLNSSAAVFSMDRPSPLPPLPPQQSSGSLQSDSYQPPVHHNYHHYNHHYHPKHHIPASRTHSLPPPPAVSLSGSSSATPELSSLFLEPLIEQEESSDDDFEPLSLDDATDEGLLKDFSNFWLVEKRKFDESHLESDNIKSKVEESSYHQKVTQYDAHSVVTPKIANRESYKLLATKRAATQSDSEEWNLRRSVTRDSNDHDKDCAGPPTKRARSMSFELSHADLLLTSDSLDNWGVELDLGILGDGLIG